MKNILKLVALSLAISGPALATTSDEELYFKDISKLVQTAGLRYAPSDYCDGVFRDHYDLFKPAYVTGLPYKLAGINPVKTKNTVNNIANHSLIVQWLTPWESPTSRIMNYRKSDISFMFTIEQFNGVNTTSNVGKSPTETNVCVTVLDYGRL